MHVEVAAAVVVAQSCNSQRAVLLVHSLLVALCSQQVH
jgi:hypothetical protein